MTSPQGGTISEQILSRKCGRSVRAGEIAICRVDTVVGTDGSGPMAIDYFEQMHGRALFDPSRVYFSLDHYAPPDTAATRAFHTRIQEFADRYGATVFDVGEGISHQILVERGLEGEVEAGQRLDGEQTSHFQRCPDPAALAQAQLLTEQGVDRFQGGDLAALELAQRVLQHLERTGHLEPDEMAADAVQGGGGGAHRRASRAASRRPTAS